MEHAFVEEAITVKKLSAPLLVRELSATPIERR